MLSHSLLKWARRMALVVAACTVAPAWSATGVYVDSPAGDWIGGGQQYTFTSATGSTSGGGSLVTVDFSGWSARFEATSGHTLVTGNYEGATRYPFNSPAQPGLAVSSPGRGCNQLEGWFEIHEALYSGSTVVAFAADLLQSCDGGPPLFAAIRINSTVPLQRPQPYARAPAASVADEGELVLLDGAASFDRDSEVSYEWTQVAGTPVTLSDTSVARPTFTAPDVAAGGEALRFSLTVRDSTDNADSVSVTVTVHDSQDLRTRVFLDSDGGDWIGQGLTYRYDEGDASIVADPLGSALRVNIDGLEQWDAEFALPAGASWAPGMYAGAQRYPFQQSTRPGIDFSGEGRGCNEISGWFEIVEIEVVGNTVMRLAVDFLQHCEGGAPALFGAIRINSNVPLDRQVPYAAAPTGGTVSEGESFTLDGSGSSSRAGGATYQWTQTGGTAVTLNGANSAIASFIAPEVVAGGETLTFVLTVTDANGHTDSITVTLHVADSSDPRTRAYIDSPAGDWIGQGQQRWFSAPGDPITASTSGGGALVHVEFGDGWGATFEAPSGQVIAPGNFEGATRYPFNSASAPGLAISGPGRGCNQLQGWFEVHEAAYSGSTVTVFAADFVQSCDGGPALFGAVRINSALPLQRSQPYARASGPGSVTEGNAVQLDGSASFDRSGPIASYAWTQTEGPAVALSGAASPQLRFTAPAVAPGGQTLRFRLAVTDGSGNADAVEVAVLVHDAADPRTRVWLDSEAGDWVGAGLTWHYDESNAQITASYDGGVSGHIEGDTWWSASFVPPQGGAGLQVGTYAGAQRYPFQSPKLPGLSFSGDGRGCNTLGGWFEVVELQVVGSTVLSAAIDFRQHCEEGAPALFGAFRIGSGVPLERNVPYAIAGSDLAVQEGTAILLDGRRSWSRSSNALTYFWRQTAGPSATILNPNSATPSVQAPPGGGELRFELAVSDGPGRADVDEVRVLVRPRSEPQTYLVVDSDFGDYIGQGRHWFFSKDTGNVTVARNPDAGVRVSIDDGNYWNLDFAGPSDAVLQPGSYENAQRYPFQSAGRPGLSWSGDGRGCNTLSGRFRVFRIAYNADGSVKTAAIDFEQHCEGATPAARGKLRINFAPENEPVANAGPDGQAPENTVVQLDGSASVDLQGAITYSWRQTYGRTVALTGADTARPSFTPLMLQNRLYAETYTFVLTVTDAEGFTAEDSVSVEVFSPHDGDGDGVPDTYDAFPNDPAEQADTDADGVGNNADAFPNDASETGDGDGDGVGDNTDAFPSNPAEWADGDGDGIGNNADAFPLDPAESRDSDGDGTGDNADALPHDPAETADDDGDGVGNNADAFPANPAENRDSDGDGTGDNADALPHDYDNDGKPDSTEQIAPHGGDGNGDGVPDARQANVASFVDATGAPVTLVLGTGASLVSARGIVNPDPAGAPSDVTFDRGFFDIDIGVPPGGAATVEILLHGAAAPGRYVKYGPAAGGGSAFYDFGYNGATGAQILADRIVLHFVDGARGDADGLENGVIADPGGPAWTKPSKGSGGGPMSPWLLMVLAALVAGRAVRSRQTAR